MNAATMRSSLDRKLFLLLTAFFLLTHQPAKPDLITFTKPLSVRAVTEDKKYSSAFIFVIRIPDYSKEFQVGYPNTQIFDICSPRTAYVSY